MNRQNGREVLLIGQTRWSQRVVTGTPRHSRQGTDGVDEVLIEDSSGGGDSIPVRSFNPFVSIAAKGIGRQRIERDDHSPHCVSIFNDSSRSQRSTPLGAHENSFNLQLVKLVEPGPVKLKDFVHPL